MRFIGNLSKISSKSYLAALITFFMRLSHFMSLPFLAIYLARQGLFSPGEIGLVLGISGFVLSLTGLINGLYADRRSQKTILIAALFLSAACYFGFAFSMQLFYGLLLLNAALGWFRSLIEVSSVKMLVMHSKEEHLKYAYSARFIAGNLGVVLGPLLGALMATHQSLFIFYLAALINLVLAIFMLFYSEPAMNKSNAQPRFRLTESFVTIMKDSTLLNLTLINFVIWVTYSQIDTTLPQYLAYEWKNPAVLFSVLMAINALICVFFQPFVQRLAEMISTRYCGYIGCGLFCSAFLLLSFVPTAFAMIVAVVLMTSGELFILPINGLLIMRIAPKHLIASYNGFANLSLLGLTVGPVLGGYGLQWIGGRKVFLCCGLLPMLAIAFYSKLPKKE